MQAALVAAIVAGQALVGSAEPALVQAAREVEEGNLGAATQRLRSLEERRLSSTVRRQIDLLLGILLLRQEQPTEAIPHLERAAATYPLMADYALYHLAKAHRNVDQPAAVATTLRRLLDHHPESLFLERASRELPRAWLEAGDLSQAEEAARQYLSGFPQAVGAAEVWVTLGEVLLQTGRADAAEEVWRRVWVELPHAAESQRAKDLLATIPEARPFTEQERFQRAATLHQLGRYGQAVSELAPFAVPGDPRQARARLLLGMGSFHLRQYPQALQWLEPLRGSPLGSEAQQEVLYWMGRSYGRLGDSTRLVEVMTLLAATARQTRRGEEALYILAQAAVDKGEVTPARAYLARLLSEHPRGVWTDAGLWLQGWLGYKERDLLAALAAWDRLLAEEPGSRFRTPTLYWRARALEAAGRPKQAAQAYHLLLEAAPDQHYYWFRARERLGRLGQKSARPVPALGSRDKRAVESKALHAKKARALRELGLAEEAAEEYSHQVRTHPEDRGGLADACRGFLDLKRYEKAVWLAGQILRPLFVQMNGRPPVPGFWTCLYPLGYWPVVREQATRQGLDPYLVAALIREESAFAPRAVSAAGARGLMQLLPQTAGQVAREHKVSLGMTSPLEVPEVNIWLGTIHLADLVRDHGGNLHLALASYNAGQPQVRRWLQRFSPTDDEEFTEDIPYTETRNYVKRVLGSYQRYASLYRAKTAESREPKATKKTGAKR